MPRSPGECKATHIQDKKGRVRTMAARRLSFHLFECPMGVSSPHTHLVVSGRGVPHEPLTRFYEEIQKRCASRTSHSIQRPNSSEGGERCAREYKFPPRAHLGLKWRHSSLLFAPGSASTTGSQHQKTSTSPRRFHCYSSAFSSSSLAL